jgi:RNA polymerase sigma-70 factor (ECF subfamily)
MQAAAAPSCPDRETELLAAVARGDRRAFEELYVRYRQRLARFLLRIAPRHEIAEEVINDTFWVVWHKAKEFRGDSRVSTWIMGIAYRRALKMLRRARADLPSAGGQPVVVEPAADESDKEAEQRDWLIQGLRQLSPEQRTSLELAYYFGYSCEEIAQIMDCGVPAVKGRMLRAREKLRVSLPQLAGGIAISRTRPMGSRNAALAVLAIGLSIWGAASWMHGGATLSDAPYRTVTLPAPVMEGAVIRAVFAPSLALKERSALLDRAGLKIVAGPTEAGVYSLAPVSIADSARLESALRQLRAHPGVSFAEPIAEVRHE